MSLDKRIIFFKVQRGNGVVERSVHIGGQIAGNEHLSYERTKTIAAYEVGAYTHYYGEIGLFHKTDYGHYFMIYTKREVKSWSSI